MAVNYAIGRKVRVAGSGLGRFLRPIVIGCDGAMARRDLPINRATIS